MTASEREALRAAVDAARRALAPLRCPETGQSPNYAYRQLRCRCTTCASYQQEQRDRRKRGDLRGVAHERKEHGVAAYKSGRCRCEICRKLANEARRRRYERAKQAS